MSSSSPVSGAAAAAKEKEKEKEKEISICYVDMSSMSSTMTKFPQVIDTKEGLMQLFASLAPPAAASGAKTPTSTPTPPSSPDQQQQQQQQVRSTLASALAWSAMNDDDCGVLSERVRKFLQKKKDNKT
jgi:hypothetical protein